MSHFPESTVHSNFHSDILRLKWTLFQLRHTNTYISGKQNENPNQKCCYTISILRENDSKVFLSGKFSNIPQRTKKVSSMNERTVAEPFWYN